MLLYLRERNSGQVLNLISLLIHCVKVAMKVRLLHWVLLVVLPLSTKNGRKRLGGITTAAFPEPLCYTAYTTASHSDYFLVLFVLNFLYVYYFLLLSLRCLVTESSL